MIGATGIRMNLINDSDRHMARMLCVMALKSSEDTGRRVARMHLSTAQDGKIQGRIAYGWVRKGPNKGKRIPEESARVAWIYEQCLSGESGHAIATTLNTKDVPSPAGTRWSSVMVNKMLRNPRYAGMVSYGGKHRVGSAHTYDGWSLVLFDDDGHPLLGNWEQIVTPKDWPQTQFELQLCSQKSGMLAGRRTGPIVVRHELSGILTCGRCSRGLVGNTVKKSGNRYYRCPAPANGGCGKVNISAEICERAIAKAMTTYLERLLRSAVEPEEALDPNQLAENRARLHAAVSRKKDLMQRWNTGRLKSAGLTEEDFYELLGTTNREIEKKRRAMTMSSQKSPPPKHTERPRTHMALWKHLSTTCRHEAIPPWR
ncbi:recombinase family protein [Streptomyces sp. NPDC001770]